MLIDQWDSFMLEIVFENDMKKFMEFKRWEQALKQVIEAKDEYNKVLEWYDRVIEWYEKLILSNKKYLWENQTYTRK